MKRSCFILLLASLFICPGIKAQQVPLQSRTALIIGNSDYLSGPLKNTVNDARSMARALRKSGFDVILREDVSNKDELKRVIRDFGSRLDQHGTALFYYSGHGLQMDGFNYIVPVNAIINSQEEVEYECVDMGFVLAMMESSRTDINIVILDACRNNPFARSFRSATQGLASMSAPTGTIIAYSTGPNSVAADGEGVNGLYTQELLKQINTPGLKVEDVFKNVRRNVISMSEEQQIPWETSSLIGDFYFIPETGQQGVTEGSIYSGLQGKQTTVKQAEEAQGQLAQESPANADPGQGNPGNPGNREDSEQTKERKNEQGQGNKPGNEEAVHSENTPGRMDVNDIPMPFKRVESKIARFRWRATQDGVFYLQLNGEELSKETIYILRGEDLHVYHPATDLLFVFDSFVYRMDGRWRKGKAYK